MCGITAFFARESVPDYKHIDTLFKGCERRGTDGFGYTLIRKVDGVRKIFQTFRWPGPYSEVANIVKETIDDLGGLKIGDVIIGIARAAPETEASVNPKYLNQTVQPIVNEDENICLVHNGAISQRIYQELYDWAADTHEYNHHSVIDSEAIIASYIKHERNLKDAMEYISGGVAAIMYDEKKDMLYVINDFKPIAHGYVKGLGFFLHSDNDVLGDIIQDITSCTRDGVNLWECYYHHYLSGGRIKQLDLQSGFMQNIKYSPRYVIGKKWDSNNPKSETKEPLCLVAASGGLDSSLTLSMLKLAGYNNIIACHFNYGHRGAAAEQMAIENICKELDIECHVIDIEDQMKAIDKTSMLIDDNAEITTGTAAGLKQVDAWVNCRNMQFLTWMCTLAESKVMEYEYSEVYFLGGFLNLSESGHYPDNSEYFLDSFLNFAKYGSLIGNRIKPLYALSNLMKYELFALIKEFKLEDVYRHTISCDRPIVTYPEIRFGAPVTEKPVARNCMKDGMPACGSGLLSYWGSKMVGLDDMKMRNFYEVDDPDYQAHIPQHIKDQFSKKPDIDNIIDRILLPKDKLDNLRSVLENINK
jgi:7-cyano-7-deazaguanine synthase in queuosine biosynthesis/predicted glutamine amidotransferase